MKNNYQEKDVQDTINKYTIEEEIPSEKNWSGRIKASFNNRNFRSGVYVSLITAMVFVIILVVNLIVSKMDLTMDLSKHDIYTLTEPTLELLDRVQDDITIYYLAETGKEADVFEKIGQKYASYSNKISFVNKDPILYPRFAAEYVEDEINSNSFLIVNNNNKRAKYIDNSEVLIRELNYETLQYVTIGIDVEGKITSAIQYVTTENIPTIYITTGHEEKATGEVFNLYMNKMNVKTAQLALLTEPIPEDCDMLLIYGPSYDFTEDEVNKVKNYMAQGGNVILIADHAFDEFPHLKSLMEYYGIEFVPGILCEGDTSHYNQYPNYLVPKLLDHNLTKKAAGMNRVVLVPNSSGLILTNDRRSTLTIEPLMQTSDKAYSKINLQATTMSREDGDIDGPFYLGILAKDTYKGVTSSLVVYSSHYIFDENTISQYGNAAILLDTVGSFSGENQVIVVKTRSLIPDAIQVNQAQRIFWGGILIILIPLIILGVGTGVTIYRRRA